MAIKVRIPVPLRRLTNKESVVEASGETIIDIIENLEIEYPGIKERLCDEIGEIRRFVNVYLNMEDIRYLDGKKSKVKDGDEISLVPAVAGG